MSITPLETIVEQWNSRADDLADFVMQYLLNREDAYGNYRSIDDRAEGTARTVRSKLTRDIIVRHFESDDRGNLIGLHTTSPDNQCRWCVVDIDYHQPGAAPSGNRNESAALQIYEEMAEYDLVPILMRSNGNGGYHLWFIFDRPVDSSLMYEFGLYVVCDWERYALQEQPESFPKQAKIHKGGLGNWVRLPGLHHTREFYTEVWNGNDWLTGAQAIDFICTSEALSASLLEEKGFTVDPDDDEFELPRNDSDTPYQRFIERLSYSQPSGTGVLGICPAHPDEEPSLSVSEAKDGRVLFHCHAGCEPSEILESLGLDWSDCHSSQDATNEPIELPRTTAQQPAVPIFDFEAFHTARLATTTENHLKQLSGILSVSVDALRQIRVAWDSYDQCWLFPEVDHEGKILGVMRRYQDGSKRLKPNGQRGLYIPESLNLDQSMVVVTEGGSDTAAAVTMGWNAVGRPNAGGGINHLIHLLRGYSGEVLILRDNDVKRDGKWPGKAGAEKVATMLGESIKADVLIGTVPMDCKDLRDVLAKESDVA